MMDLGDLKGMFELSRQQVLGLLEAIEKTGKAPEILAWRPGPGRAHIGWQLMHVAATDDRFINVRLQGKEPSDFAKRFASGSTPSDDGIPTVAEIRSQLAAQREMLLAYAAKQTPSQLDTVLEVAASMPRRTVRQWYAYLALHETHHHGQAHLTHNLYKAAQQR